MSAVNVLHEADEGVFSDIVEDYTSRTVADPVCMIINEFAEVAGMLPNQVWMYMVHLSIGSHEEAVWL